MNNFLSFSKKALSTSILSASILLSPIVNAEEKQQRSYSPAAEFSGKFSKGRNIAELNYMQPFLASDDKLPIIDVKLKLDDKKSKEINLGLVYRYNLNDKVILGAYTYFDHRITQSNFSVSGLTAGLEVLSKYIDARANLYIPQNKRKKITHNNNKTVEISGTSIFAISGGHRYESALKGYDAEIGMPLFAFSDLLNEKIGTKIYAGAYRFDAKNVKAISGTRFRLEQDLGKAWLGNNSYKFHVNAETQYDKVRKRQNFIGLGVKITFNDKKDLYKKNPQGLQHRMMDTVIRDVDIVTESIAEALKRHNFKMNGKEIKKIYYVGSASDNYSGDGTKEKPMSIKQFKEINSDDAVIVVTTIDASKGGTNISNDDHSMLSRMPQVLNGKEKVVLESEGDDKVIIEINGKNGISISSPDSDNTKIIVENNQNIPVDKRVELIKQIEAETLTDEQALIQEQEVEQGAGQQAAAQEDDQQPVAREAEDNQQPEAQQAVAQGEDQLAPENTFDSEIDEANLTPLQLELYQLIRNAELILKADGDADLYVKRQKRYKKIKKLIKNNPNDGIDEIKNKIDQIANLDWNTKNEYKKTAEKMMYFNGTVQGNSRNGGQQGIGGDDPMARAGTKSVKDVTSTASLERLRASYGILNGDRAIELMENIIICALKEDIPDIDANPGDIALSHHSTVPTDEYKRAVKDYLHSLKPPLGGENDQQRDARIRRLNDARIVIDKEVKKSKTAVNRTMAAYRAARRMGTGQEHELFTETVLGRYNDREMLAYAILANIDVREIQKNLQEARKDLTAENVFSSQQENLRSLINNLGDSQRGYNMEHIGGEVDIGGVDIEGLYPVPWDETGIDWGAKMSSDASSCAHGLCVRIIDSTIHHSKVSLSDASPASFSDEFNSAVKQRFKKLDVTEQASILDWNGKIDDFNLTVKIKGDKTVKFKTPPRGNQVDIPVSYKKILSDVAAEMDTRYNYTHDNPKIQLVKKAEATGTFENARWINLD